MVNNQGSLVYNIIYRNLFQMKCIVVTLKQEMSTPGMHNVILILQTSRLISQPLSTLYTILYIPGQTPGLILYWGDYPVMHLLSGRCETINIHRNLIPYCNWSKGLIKHCIVDAASRHQTRSSHLRHMPTRYSRTGAISGVHQDPHGLSGEFPLQVCILLSPTFPTHPLNHLPPYTHSHMYGLYQP